MNRSPGSRLASLERFCDSFDPDTETFPFGVSFENLRRDNPSESLVHAYAASRRSRNDNIDIGENDDIDIGEDADIDIGDDDEIDIGELDDFTYNSMGSSTSRPATTTSNNEPIDLTDSPPPSPPYSPRSPVQEPNMNRLNPSRKRTPDEAELSSSDSGTGPSESTRQERRVRRRRVDSTTSRHLDSSILTPAAVGGPNVNAPVTASATGFVPLFGDYIDDDRTPPPPAANRTIEQIDLCDDENPPDRQIRRLQETLQKQRADAIASQNASTAPSTSTSANTTTATAPTTSPAASQSLSPRSKRRGHTRLTIQTCTVCLEPPTDLTATACGHSFCRQCLMDWLVSAERDQGRRANCPACRKALVWRDGAAGSGAAGLGGMTGVGRGGLGGMAGVPRGGHGGHVGVGGHAASGKRDVVPVAFMVRKKARVQAKA